MSGDFQDGVQSRFIESVWAARDYIFEDWIEFPGKQRWNVIYTQKKEMSLN